MNFVGNVIKVTSHYGYKQVINVMTKEFGFDPGELPTICEIKKQRPEIEQILIPLPAIWGTIWGRLQW